MQSMDGASRGRRWEAGGTSTSCGPHAREAANTIREVTQFPANPARLRPEPLPISAGGDPCVSLEEIAEKGDILITDRITDLLHGAMIAL
jgi:hypothetical protein